MATNLFNCTDADAVSVCPLVHDQSNLGMTLYQLCFKLGHTGSREFQEKLDSCETPVLKFLFKHLFDSDSVKKRGSC